MSVKKFNQEQLLNLRNAFDSFDEDNDGLVAPDNLERLLRCLSFNPTPEEIEDMLDDLQNKPFNFNCFAYIVSRHSRCNDTENDLIDSFKLFDKDHSGVLPVETIRKILQSIKQPFTNEQLDDLLQHVEVEGFVDYSNLVHLLLTQ